MVSNYMAERRIYDIFDGKFHASEQWFRAAYVSLHLFPFERNTRRISIGILRASGQRLLEEMNADAK